MKARDIQMELAEEYIPIEEKLTKLTEFIGGDVFIELSAPTQKLLIAQSTAMGSYINILIARIALLNYEKETK